VSRRVVVAGVLIGPYLGVKIAPGFARSLKEADALADALLVPRRVRREAAKNAATRGVEVTP
jgi:hypothetical protein